MYKTLGVVFCLILVLFCSPNSDFLSSFDKFEGGEVFFCTNVARDFKQSLTLKNGQGYIISTEQNVARAIQNSISANDLNGIAVRFENGFDCDDYLKSVSASILFNETVGDTRFIYAYTPKFKRFVNYNGQKINIQIAQNTTHTVVGYPLILIGA